MRAEPIRWLLKNRALEAATSGIVAEQWSWFPAVDRQVSEEAYVIKQLETFNYLLNIPSYFTVPWNTDALRFSWVKM